MVSSDTATVTEHTDAIPPKTMRNRLFSLSAMALAVAAFPVYALDPASPGDYTGLSITPRIGLGETYTTNVALAPDSQAMPGWITQITPGVTIKDSTSRTRFVVDYSFQDMIYDNYGMAHQYFNQLNANGTAELVKQNLYIDAGATISQQPMLPIGPVSANAANLTGNVANITTESVSPYWVHQFGTEATSVMRYTRIDSNYGYAGPSPVGGSQPYAQQYLQSAYSFSSQANIIDALIKNGSDFGRVEWTLEYNDAITSYTGYPSATLAMLTASVNYILTPDFKLTSQFGYEKDNYAYLGEPPQSTLWSTGFEWAPSPRTKLTASVGERFFGRTYTLDFNHRSRMTVWDASYNQTVQTAIMQQTVPPQSALDSILAGQIPDPAARQQAIQQIMSAMGAQSSLFGLNVITNEVYLSKIFQASTGITFHRDAAMLTVFNNRTIPLQQPPQPGVPGAIDSLLSQGGYLAYGEMDQVGSTLTFTHQVSKQTLASMSASASRFNFPGQSFQETSTYMQAGLTRQLGRKTSGSLTLRHQMMNSMGSGGYSFVESAAIASISMIF